MVDRYPIHLIGKFIILFFRLFKTGSRPFLSGGMQFKICVTPSKMESSGITSSSLLKIKLLGSSLSDLELVNAMQPNFLIDLAK